ncbi:unnamed protein product [Periconia digitata]|uniref:Uncharacterized protein n=1 Tax=Periconia digitata TaxID=1303443 RepID=A0A9W4XJC6_9PLEO|nr:unnamed protein product [Periconia digitata]
MAIALKKSTTTLQVVNNQGSQSVCYLRNCTVFEHVCTQVADGTSSWVRRLATVFGVFLLGASERGSSHIPDTLSCCAVTLVVMSSMENLDQISHHRNNICVTFSRANCNLAASKMHSQSAMTDYLSTHPGITCSTYTEHVKLSPRRN